MRKKDERERKRKRERERENDRERGGEREGERERTISKITSILLKTPKLMIQIKFQI